MDSTSEGETELSFAGMIALSSLQLKNQIRPSCRTVLAPGYTERNRPSPKPARMSWSFLSGPRHSILRRKTKISFPSPEPRPSAAKPKTPAPRRPVEACELSVDRLKKHKTFSVSRCVRNSSSSPCPNVIRSHAFPSRPPTTDEPKCLSDSFLYRHQTIGTGLALPRIASTWILLQRVKPS